MQASMSSPPFGTRLALANVTGPARFCGKGADFGLAGLGEFRGSG